MRSIAIVLGAVSVLTLPVGAQQPPPSPMPVGPSTTQRPTGEEMLAIPKLDPKAVVSLQLTGPLTVVLDRISGETGVKLSFDAAVTDLSKPATVKLSNATAEEALTAALKPQGLAFRALFPKAALIYPDTPERRAFYTDVLQTFPIAHADVATLTQLLNRTFTPGAAASGKPRPVIVANRDARTISVRVNAAVMAEIARMIAENDK